MLFRSFHRFAAHVGMLRKTEQNKLAEGVQKQAVLLLNGDQFFTKNIFLFFCFQKPKVPFNNECFSTSDSAKKHQKNRFFSSIILLNLHL